MLSLFTTYIWPSNKANHCTIATLLWILLEYIEKYSHISAGDTLTYIYSGLMPGKPRRTARRYVDAYMSVDFGELSYLSVFPGFYTPFLSQCSSSVSYWLIGYLHDSSPCDIHITHSTTNLSLTSHIIFSPKINPFFSIFLWPSTFFPHQAKA